MTGLDAVAISVDSKRDPKSVRLTRLLTNELDGVLDTNPWATQDAANFVTAAGQWYRTNASHSFPQFTAQDVLQCILPWQQTQIELASLAQLQFKTYYYEQAVVFNNQVLLIKVM
jgi:hypothetical protein